MRGVSELNWGREKDQERLRDLNQDPGRPAGPWIHNDTYGYIWDGLSTIRAFQPLLEWWNSLGGPPGVD